MHTCTSTHVQCAYIHVCTVCIHYSYTPKSMHMHVYLEGTRGYHTFKQTKLPWYAHLLLTILFFKDNHETEYIAQHSSGQQRARPHTLDLR